MKFDIQFLKANIILVLLICLTTFLRTYKIDTHGILFPDAAKDLLTAHQAWKDGSIPLLGIASSRPWLHQGPIALWIELLVIALFGVSTLAQSVTFALLAIAAVIALYELVTIYYSKQAAYFAVALLATMPLAVAHSRVPYHTTPIPLAMVLFLWSLVALWQKFTLKQLFLSILAWIVLFQFEISNAPLALLIPFVLIRKRYRLTLKQILGCAGVLLIGFLPQLFAALRGESNQLVAFGKWAASQSSEAVTAVGSSSFDKIVQTGKAFWLYGGRLFGVDSSVLSVLGGLLLVGSLGFCVYQIIKKKLPPLVELTLLAFSVLTAAYCVVGSPSEAYFPPYFILVPILIGYLFSSLASKFKVVATFMVVLLLVVNSVVIVRSNFFVQNGKAFQYDSVGEHRQIAKLLALRSSGATYQLRSWSVPDLPNFLDHIKWLALEIGGAQAGDSGRLYYVEGSDQQPPPQTILIQKFPTKTVYWFPQLNTKSSKQ